MAVTDEQWTLAEATWPDVDVTRVAFVYDQPTDTLFADLHGHPLPAVTEPLDGSQGTVSLRVRWDGNDVIGIMVEGYAKHAVKLYPHWRDLAPFAMNPQEALPAGGDAASAATNRAAIVERFLAETKAIWAANVAAERQAVAG